ncbi:MAG: methyltransferase family protein [Nocardioidaceae bacterium]
MRRREAAVGSAGFFVVAPLMVAGVLPWWISRSDTWRYDPPGWTRIVGVVLVVAGVAVLVHSFVRFVAARGTPAPVAPTERLVVDGAYRFVRNPMYVAVVTISLGQGLVHGSGLALAYAGLVWAVTASFVRLYEEPALRRQFGPEYDTYCAGVPGWVPRLTPWTGDPAP